MPNAVQRWQSPVYARLPPFLAERARGGSSMSQHLPLIAGQRAVLSGTAASPGTASGLAFLYRPPALRPDQRVPQDVAQERERLARALAAAGAELAALRAEAVKTVGEERATIFDIQLTFLADPLLMETVNDALAFGQDAAAAWWQAIETGAARLRGIGEETWMARASDLEDLGRRVLRHLLGDTGRGWGNIQRGQIIIAQEITPSDVVMLAQQGAVGLALASGSKTAHSIILAQALGLPAVVEVGDALLAVPEGAPVAVDGDAGLVIAWPDATLDQHCLAARPEQRHEALPCIAATTTDGHVIPVLANVGSVSGAEHAARQGADGVGLLRTEFLYLGRRELPGEEEQIATYAALLAALGGKPLVIRTLDVGSDKEMPAFDLPEEPNPALGMRGVRVSLQRADVLTTQLRAILRVAARFAADPPLLRVMFPMVTTVDEWYVLRRIWDQARAGLAAESAPPPAVPLGVMIEVPAAALMADRFAREADFLSIGSNDLIQYTLAVDRDHPAPPSLADGLQPAMLRLMHAVTQAAHRMSKRVSLCGELAADLAALPLLIGLGVDEVSVDPAMVPIVKERLRRLALADARRLAEECLALGTVGEVRARVARFK